MTQKDLVYRPEVLAEYGFRVTPDELIEELSNGIQLHHERVSYGIWHALTPEERATAAGGEAIWDTTSRREREALLVQEFQMMHRADATVTHPPTDTFVTHALLNFGYAFWVSEGRAVGYMALCDGTDDPATWDGVYEALTNIWVVHARSALGCRYCASGIRAGSAGRSDRLVGSAFLPGRRRLGAG